MEPPHTGRGGILEFSPCPPASQAAMGGGVLIAFVVRPRVVDTSSEAGLGSAPRRGSGPGAAAGTCRGVRGKRSPRGRTAAGTHTRRPRTEGPRTLARESPPLSHVAAAAAQHLPRANTAGHGRVAQSVRPMRGRQRRRRAARGWSVSRHRQLTVTRAAREHLWYADPFIFKREM